MKDKVERGEPPSETLTTSDYVTFMFTFDQRERALLWLENP